MPKKQCKHLISFALVQSQRKSYCSPRLKCCFFDGINHAFATIATGGFSTRSMSIAEYNSLPIEIIVMLFMVLSGIHFGLIFQTFKTHSKNNIFQSSVAKSYLMVLAIGILLVSAKLWQSRIYGPFEALRYGSFQVISVGTTTGFATAESSVWPPFTQIIIFHHSVCHVSVNFRRTEVRQGFYVGKIY